MTQTTPACARELAAQYENISAVDRALRSLADQLEQAQAELTRMGLRSGIVAHYKEDAELYRWLRAQTWDQTELCVVQFPVLNVRLGANCPSGDLLDAAIRAAIAKGAAT